MEIQQRALALPIAELGLSVITRSELRFGVELRKSDKLSGSPIGGFDTLIAAHALALDMTLVTHNTRHFEKVPGLRLLDWVNG